MLTTAEALVYTSATGSTRRYAELISRATGLPAYDLSLGLGPDKGRPVLYLGWLCAGGIKGLKKARKRYDVRAVCAVGMAEPEAEYTKKLAEDNKLGATPIFYLRGGYDPDKLTGIYRLMMKPMVKMVAKAPAEDEQAAAMKEAFVQGGDWVTEEQIVPVLAFLSGLPQ